MDTGNETCFVEFPKMARLSRECVITEKIDGTNACINIVEEALIPDLVGRNSSIFLAHEGTLYLMAGSRTRWITPQDDNYGFAKWAQEHAAELFELGPGRHFGEWWGQGIQRNYGLKEKRFSLFNVGRWKTAEDTEVFTDDKRLVTPKCCGVVPVLYRGVFLTDTVDYWIKRLAYEGSHAAPGFMDPEGVVVYHTAGNVGFKKTLKGDEHKGKISA